MGAVQADGIKWSAAVRVEKYSPDQVQWAAGNRGCSSRKAIVLRVLCGEPEEGTVERIGNLLVTVGLNNLTELIIGSGGTSLDQAHTIAGVGASTANNAAIGDTALADDNSANAYYQNVDSGSNPSQSNGVISAYVHVHRQSNANFAWNEWCLAVTSGTDHGGHSPVGDGLAEPDDDQPQDVLVRLGTKSQARAGFSAVDYHDLR